MEGTCSHVEGTKFDHGTGGGDLSGEGSGRDTVRGDFDRRHTVRYKGRVDLPTELDERAERVIRA
jgi:hypothetical protein